MCTSNLITIFINIIGCKFNQGSSSKFLPLTFSLSTNLFRKWTSILRSSIQYLYPRVISSDHRPLHPTPSRDHRERSQASQQASSSSGRSGPTVHHSLHVYRQYVGLLLGQRWYIVILFGGIRFLLRRIASRWLRSISPITEFENQFPVFVEHVIVIMDLTFSYQLAVKVTALISHSSWYLPRKNSPLYLEFQKWKYLVIDSLSDKMKKEFLILLTPFASRLGFSRIVEAIIVLIWICFAVSECFNPRITPSQATERFHRNRLPRGTRQRSQELGFL